MSWWQFGIFLIVLSIAYTFWKWLWGDHEEDMPRGDPCEFGYTEAEHMVDGRYVGCPHRLNDDNDPFNCPGPECHDGGFPGFDHFCDVLNVSSNETPHAFAAWLAGTTEWDGDYGPVTDDNH